MLAKSTFVEGGHLFEPICFYVTTSAEVVVVAQDIVKWHDRKEIPIIRNLCIFKSQRFDESHQVSSRVVVEVANFSDRIGRTSNVHASI